MDARPEQTTAGGADPTACSQADNTVAERTDWSNRPEDSKSDPIDMALVAMGAILAGGVYPLAVGLILLIVSSPDWSQVLWGLLSSGQVGAFVGTIGSVLWAAIAACIAGMCCASFGAVLQFIPWVVVRSMRLRVHPVRFGAFAGGFALALCVTLVVLLEINFSRPRVLWPQIVLGPCLATIMGQLGGAWGGFRSLVLSRGGIIYLTPKAQADPGRSSRRRYQFQIRHLLWLGFWLSLMLAGIRLAGLPPGPTLAIASAWLAYQALTLAAGQSICRHLWPRYLAWHTAKRASRCT